jgi:uncharacterized membrane protein YcaP (DUF421 family)
VNLESFFDGWSGLGRVVVVGTLAYVSLVFVLRISGKRTLSKMNASDLVVTIALGSTLATIILSRDVALAEGVVAMVLLIGLQYAVTWSSMRSPFISRLVKSEPTLVFYQGRFLREPMRQARVMEDEIQAVVRQQGMASLADVEAVILETDGTMAVVAARGGDQSALRSVGGIAQRQ